MRKLFEMDKKDYGGCTHTFTRNSARSIIIRDQKIAMVHSLKYDYYKFPGGGIRNGEDPVEALIRETREEAGLIVIPETVREYGCVHRIQKSDQDDTECFVQDNFYYLCEAENELTSQELDDYEAEESFRLEYTDAETAIAKNRDVKDTSYNRLMFEREARVLELLQSEGYLKAAGTAAAEKTGMKLERMDDFFAARVDGYDEHMRTEIEGASDFYAFTASLLPMEKDARVLDLGCGTGLELEEYFRLNPEAAVTGIDLSDAMLKALKAKFPDRKLDLIRNSYFDTDLGRKAFDAAVSVESLHHFPAEQKVALYRKLYAALKDGGCFVLTDYFAESEELERENFRNLEKLKQEQSLSDGTFYHYDTPLTVGHEIQVLRQAGFSKIRIMKQWGSTFTLHAGS